MTTAHIRQDDAPSTPARRTANKVPQVTALFWVIKVLTTGMGETASDFLAHVMDPMIAVALGALGLAISLAVQFRARRYTAWTYWTAVVMVSVFGTMAADVLHVGLGVPYPVAAPFFLLALAAIFGAWYATERTLSVDRVDTRRREAFYWATVLATFALGTAVGDLAATTLGFGYLASGVTFTVFIAVPALAHRRFGLGAVAAFWSAYVLTRPLGASFADWMAHPAGRGGLGLGLGPVTLGWTVVILALVGYLGATRRDALDR
ncbi:COG4705 family protein [Streptomyces lavendulae]|uniref:COG4705 family protein n=1 Tax=Streptomyces lavendulae TaxID=1914 RepID=UPI00369C6BCB